MVGCPGPKENRTQHGVHRAVGRRPFLESSWSHDGWTPPAKRTSRPCLFTDGCHCSPSSEPRNHRYGQRSSRPAVAQCRGSLGLNSDSNGRSHTRSKRHRRLEKCSNGIAVDHGLGNHTIVLDSDSQRHGELRHRRMGEPVVWWALCRFLHRRSLAASTAGTSL